MRSAGILAYRFSGKGLEVLLIHPGGPYWARKDLGAWSIPKGIVEEDEDESEAARREFKEETGFEAAGDMLDLGIVRYSGKTVHVWAIKGDFDASKAKSNMFEMEWPKGSGKIEKFPEADKAEWFSISEAKQKILKAQLPFLERLKE
ncbi:MAG: NUDIX domain-containing protein, partial [Candidatus Micrarchaeia archaeon]